jgi:phage major head subunit gpT-like protein
VDGERTSGRADAVDGVRCEYCHERIGVYEPMIELNGNLARQTSRAADPLLDAGAGRAFHAACYDARITP